MLRNKHMTHYKSYSTLPVGCTVALISFLVLALSAFIWLWFSPIVKWIVGLLIFVQ